MARCPLCNDELVPPAKVCPKCMERIKESEPLTRQARLRTLADGLVVALSLLLLLKGSYALFAAESYQNCISGLGFPYTILKLHFWNASVSIMAALGYAITALGNYLGKGWADG